MDNSKTKTELPVGFLFSNSKRTIEIENQVARNASKAFEAYAKSRIGKN